MLAVTFNVAFSTVALLWLAITVVLGAVGWIIGTILTPRFPAVAIEEDGGQKGKEENDMNAPLSEESAAAIQPTHEERARNE